MKKIYIFTVLFALFAMSVSAQNILAGGNMEDANSWSVSTLNTSADNTVDYQFNYTTTTPSSGAGGCLYVSGTNTGTTNGEGTNIMIYQQITAQRGTYYVFDGAYMDVRTNNYWFEVYVGGNEPQDGSDYGSDQNAVLIEAFKSSNWVGDACPNDQIDGTFLLDGCGADVSVPKDTVFFEGTGDTLVYFGFKMGIWDSEGNGYTFETFVDELTLTPVANKINTFTSNEVSISPNPFTEMITIKNTAVIREIEVMNLLGQSVKKLNANQSEVQMSLGDAKTGVYFVLVKDINGKSSISKLIKE